MALEDLLVQAAGLEVVVALLLGVELGEAEEEVRLLRIVVVGDREQALLLMVIWLILTIFPCRTPRNWSTVRTGPAAFLTSLAGACGLVSLVWGAWTSTSFLVYRAFP